MIYFFFNIGLFRDVVLLLSSILNEYLLKSVAVVTHSPPTSEVGGSNPGPYVGKMVVAVADGQQFTVQNLDIPTVCTGFLCPQNYPS